MKFDSSVPPQEFETLEPIQVHVESQSKEDGYVIVFIDENDEEVEFAVEPEDRSHRRLPTVQEELDEVVPMKKKTVSFTKKSKGKKKKKGSSSKPLTYDEAIEAETQKFSDDNFALETDFLKLF